MLTRKGEVEKCYDFAFTFFVFLAFSALKLFEDKYEMYALACEVKYFLNLLCVWFFFISFFNYFLIK